MENFLDNYNIYLKENLICVYFNKKYKHELDFAKLIENYCKRNFERIFEIEKVLKDLGQKSIENIGNIKSKEFFACFIEICLVESEKLITIINNDSIIKDHIIENDFIWRILIISNKLNLFKELLKLQFPITKANILFIYYYSAITKNLLAIELLDSYVKKNNVDMTYNKILSFYFIGEFDSRISVYVFRQLAKSAIKHILFEKRGLNDLVLDCIEQKNKLLLTEIMENPLSKNKYKTKIHKIMDKHLINNDIDYYNYIKDVGFTVCCVNPKTAQYLLDNNIKIVKLLAKDKVFLQVNPNFKNFGNYVFLEISSLVSNINCELDNIFK